MVCSFAFDGKTIRDLRNRATTCWLERLVLDGPKGWSQNTMDPMALLAFFKPLRLKPGYKLCAYQFRNCSSGRGAVWAIPVDVLYPEPVSLSPDDPPRPLGALDDFMKAIEGDGSPRSYLYASLLAREFEDFGGYGEGALWMTHLILDGDPWLNPNGAAHALAGQGFSTRVKDWTWAEPKPLDWCPMVHVNDTTVRVRFYAFSSFGRQRIIYFEDRYQKGSYVFERVEREVASGPEGIRW